MKRAQIFAVLYARHRYSIGVLALETVGGNGTVRTRFDEVVDVTAIGRPNPLSSEKVLELAGREQLTPSSQDEERVLVLGIDVQNDFMEGGALPVPNSPKDVENFSRFIYQNLSSITRIAVSLDTHRPQQIFHPAWWTDRDGQPPKPFTAIPVDAVRKGEWRPVYHRDQSVQYVEGLYQVGRRELVIWPYHCLQGTFGASLEGQFANMVYFHSLARKSTPYYIVKGQDPFTEMYGIVRPEFDPNHYVNQALLEELSRYDKIVVGGEAKSHCVLESIGQILEAFEDRTGFGERLYVLSDCMSPIPGFEEHTEKFFESLQNDRGVHIVDSTWSLAGA